jgi:hypothetical protein
MREPFFLPAPILLPPCDLALIYLICIQQIKRKSKTALRSLEFGARRGVRVPQLEIRPPSRNTASGRRLVELVKSVILHPALLGHSTSYLRCHDNMCAQV